MTALNASGWRPELGEAASTAATITTASGDRGLMLEEPLIFELGRPGTCGVDLDEPEAAPLPALARFLRKQPAALPGLTEPETVRHYTRLSRQNYAIDLGPFPLGSCTMKHNPRLNEKMARLPGFLDVHPLQPQQTVQGALGVIDELAAWLIALTGMHGVAMTPKAGAHGELCGLLCIKAAIEARGEDRPVILVPESAHGT
ncbi:MAG TPA: aminomethyl-transferring glycine dehydrogenase subunit GcvPB, partial [Novosphingobium sp.]